MTDTDYLRQQVLDAHTAFEEVRGPAEELPPDPRKSSDASGCGHFYQWAIEAYHAATAAAKAGEVLTADWYSLKGAAWTPAGDVCVAAGGHAVLSA